MLAEISAAFGSAKAIADIVGAGKGVIDQAQLASALFDLNSKLLETQGAMLTLQSENGELQQRIRVLEDAASARLDWSAEASKFEQREVASGVFAYVRTPVTDKLASVPKYCSACFEARTKAVLQLRHTQVGRQLALDCPNKHPALVFAVFLEA